MGRVEIDAVAIRHFDCPFTGGSMIDVSNFAAHYSSAILWNSWRKRSISLGSNWGSLATGCGRNRLFPRGGWWWCLIIVKAEADNNAPDNESQKNNTINS